MTPSVANVTFVTALGSAGEMFSRASGPLHCHSFTYLSFFTTHLVDGIFGVSMTVVLKEAVAKGGPMP